MTCEGHSNTTSNDHEADDTDDSRLSCYCHIAMVMCDSKQYVIQWFHFDCVRLWWPPKGNFVLFTTKQKKEVQQMDT